jgi:hypothetical protein
MLKPPTTQCGKSKTIEYPEPCPISPNIDMDGIKIYNPS